jgi:hypothetical protein
MKFKTPYNAEEFELDNEVNNLPSLTIPDQTMSIREILERFSKGLSIEQGKVPIYEGEEDYLPDLKTLDLVDRAELLEQVRKEKQELENKIVRKRRNVSQDIENQVDTENQTNEITE